jgi:hypothetical protein
VSIEFSKVLKALHDINNFNKADNAFKEFAKEYLVAPYFKRKAMMDNLLKTLEQQIERQKEKKDGTDNT